MAESVLSDGRSAMKSMIWASSFLGSSFGSKCWFCSEPLTHDMMLIVFVHEKHVFNFYFMIFHCFNLL